MQLAQYNLLVRLRFGKHQIVKGPESYLFGVKGEGGAMPLKEEFVVPLLEGGYLRQVGEVLELTDSGKTLRPGVAGAGFVGRKRCGCKDDEED